MQFNDLNWHSMKKLFQIPISVLVFATAAACTVAGAQSALMPSTVLPETITQNTAIAQPSSPQELWTRFLILLKKNGGFTNHLEVEETIGLKFTSVEKEGEKRLLGAAFFYLMKEEVPGIGLLQMGLFEDPKKSGLGIGWGPDTYELPNCKNLTLDQAKNDIEALGWVQNHVRSNQPGQNLWTFVKRKDNGTNASTAQSVNGYRGESTLTLAMPNQFSQCLNGFSTNIFRTE
jgi:hypothetical protein